MTTMTRAAHGLDSPRDDWHVHARCAAGDVDPELWHPGMGGAMGAEAAHICLNHCPVLAQCAQDATRMGDARQSSVLAGVAYTRKGQPSTVQHVARRCRICRPGGHDDHVARRRATWRESKARERATT